MAWVGEQYLLGPHENLERLIAVVLAHLGFHGERAVKQVSCCCRFLMFTFCSVFAEMQKKGILTNSICNVVCYR